MGHFKVQKMPREELDVVLERAAEEGWNPGFNDADCFWDIDPDGFFMGVLDGRPVARAAAVIYDDRFAFCGMYIVDKAYRGQGYGLAITQARLEYVGERNAGLDGVVTMQDKYKRLGYRIAHRSVRYGFTPQAQQGAPAEIVPVSTVPFPELLNYDTRHFPAQRGSFLKRWIAQPNAVALAFVDAGVLKGYGVIRGCRTGHKIGPLFADDTAVAEALFCALCNHGTGTPVFMDVPEVNAAGMDLAQRYHMHSQFECARMYLKNDPGLPLDNIFGITTFEAG